MNTIWIPNIKSNIFGNEQIQFSTPLSNRTYIQYALHILEVYIYSMQEHIWKNINLHTIWKRYQNTIYEIYKNCIQYPINGLLFIYWQITFQLIYPEISQIQHYSNIAIGSVLVIINDRENAPISCRSVLHPLYLQFVWNCTMILKGYNSTTSSSSDNIFKKTQIQKLIQNSTTQIPSLETINTTNKPQIIFEVGELESPIQQHWRVHLRNDIWIPQKTFYEKLKDSTILEQCDCNGYQTAQLDNTYDINKESTISWYKLLNRLLHQETSVDTLDIDPILPISAQNLYTTMVYSTGYTALHVAVVFTSQGVQGPMKTLSGLFTLQQWRNILRTYPAPPTLSIPLALLSTLTWDQYSSISKVPFFGVLPARSERIRFASELFICK